MRDHIFNKFRFSDPRDLIPTVSAGTLPPDDCFFVLALYVVTRNALATTTGSKASAHKVERRARTPFHLICFKSLPPAPTSRRTPLRSKRSRSSCDRIWHWTVSVFPRPDFLLYVKATAERSKGTDGGGERGGEVGRDVIAQAKCAKTIAYWRKLPPAAPPVEEGAPTCAVERITVAADSGNLESCVKSSSR